MLAVKFSEASFGHASGRLNYGSTKAVQRPGPRIEILYASSLVGSSTSVPCCSNNERDISTPITSPGGVHTKDDLHNGASHTGDFACGRPCQVAYWLPKALLRAISKYAKEPVSRSGPTENKTGIVSHGAVIWQKEGADGEMNVNFRPMAWR